MMACSILLACKDSCRSRGLPRCGYSDWGSWWMGALLPLLEHYLEGLPSSARPAAQVWPEVSVCRRWLYFVRPLGEPRDRSISGLPSTFGFKPAR